MQERCTAAAKATLTLHPPSTPCDGGVRDGRHVGRPHSTSGGTRPASRLAWLMSVLALTACVDTAGPDERRLELAKSPMREAFAKDNQKTYIVTLEPRVTAEAVARQHGIAIDQVYSHVLNGFSATLSDLARSGLLKDHRVRRIEADAAVRITSEQISPPWGLDRIDQRASTLDGLYRYGSTGAGVTAYIVDTGIRFSHEEFEGRAVDGFAWFGNAFDDCHGHGTHVAGTVGGRTYGVAKDVRLVRVWVLDCYGGGTLEGVIAGLDWIAANATPPSVVNMSLGGGANEILDEAVRNLVAAGVTVVVAAGNGFSDACSGSPAREPSALTIGATDASDRRAAWSNWGNCVDWFAPGVGVLSAGIANDQATTTMSGTSMAAPHTAGVAALYLETHPTATPQQVYEALQASTTKGVVTDAESPDADLLYSVADGNGPSNAAPAVDFNVSCIGLLCTFTDLSSDTDGTLASWTWEFGDGSEATERHPAHEYAAEGSYTVTLRANDNTGALGMQTRTIAVSTATTNQPPTAAFTASCQNLHCAFIDGSSDPDGNIISWVWDFGDGTTLSNQSSSHEFPAAGTFVVNLTVTDDRGATGSDAKQVTVTVGNAPPVAAFVYECTGLTCRFTDASTDADGTIQARYWEFGDGMTSTGPKPNHTYGASGSFGVRLTITDDRGATSSASRTVVVTVPDAPLISLTAAARKVKGIHFVDLAWTGATGSQVAIYRNDVLLLVVPNNGQYTDPTESKGRGDYVYRVCETQASVCSANLSVSLR